MEVDLSSLVLVVTDNRLENNRILEVVRRTEIKALGHEHSADSACGIEKLNEIHQKRRPKPNITRLSDDPRRGGRREQLEVPAPDKDNKGKPPMESSEAMSTILSNIYIFNPHSSIDILTVKAMLAAPSPVQQIEQRLVHKWCHNRTNYRYCLP